MYLGIPEPSQYLLLFFITTGIAILIALVFLAVGRWQRYRDPFNERKASYSKRLAGRFKGRRAKTKGQISRKTAPRRTRR